MRNLLLLIVFMCANAYSQLPQIELRGDFGNEYTEGMMKLTEANGKTTIYNIKAKWRGGSSKSYEKKSYAVKLIDREGESIDAPLLGMRSDNNWILDAMAVDKFRMRNRVSFDLWNDFSHDTYIMTDYGETESFNGTHGYFVEVTLNGSYHGVYCMTEKIDRKQLKLKKYKNGKVRGTLYKAEDWVGTQFYTYDDYDNTKPYWMGWEAKYPDLDDEGITDYEPLSDGIRFVVDSSTDEFQSKVADYFDLPVWTDYFIFINLLDAADNEGKNCFVYVYNKEKEGKLGIAPWDLDGTWGRYWDGSERTEHSLHFGHNLLRRLSAEYPNYMKMMAERYFELRKTYFTETSLCNRFTTYYDYLNSNGALEREKERWDSINSVYLDFEYELKFTSQWIKGQLAYLDKYFKEQSTGIDAIHSDVQQDSNIYYDLQGRRIEGIPTRKGIYIHNGKKVVIQ